MSIEMTECKPAKILCFDLETTGFLQSDQRIVEIGWTILTYRFPIVQRSEHKSFLIKRDVWPINAIHATKIHGITHQNVIDDGVPFKTAIDAFMIDVHKCEFLLGHNSIRFDLPFIIQEMEKEGEMKEYIKILNNMGHLDTLVKAKNIGLTKPHTLGALYRHLKSKDMPSAHRTDVDVDATIDIFCEMNEYMVKKVRDVLVSNESC